MCLGLLSAITHEVSLVLLDHHYSSATEINNLDGNKIWIAALRAENAGIKLKEVRYNKRWSHDVIPALGRNHAGNKKKKSRTRDDDEMMVDGHAMN